MKDSLDNEMFWISRNEALDKLYALYCLPEQKQEVRAAYANAYCLVRSMSFDNERSLKNLIESRK